MNDKRKPASYYGVMFYRGQPIYVRGPSGKRSLATGAVLDTAAIGDLRGWTSVAEAIASPRDALPLGHVKEYAYRVYERRGNKLKRTA